MALKLTELHLSKLGVYKDSPLQDIQCQSLVEQLVGFEKDGIDPACFEGLECPGSGNPSGASADTLAMLKRFSLRFVSRKEEGGGTTMSPPVTSGAAFLGGGFFGKVLVFELLLQSHSISWQFFLTPIVKRFSYG